MKASIEIRTPLPLSDRVLQLEQMFDLERDHRETRRWEIDLPIEDRPWNIGLFVGPSGSGKSTLANTLFHGATQVPTWSDTASIVDGFPTQWSIDRIIHLLSSVGFSSPPSWRRPFATLSAGEQFRVNLACQIAHHEAESPTRPMVVDEYSSLIDRSVARSTSMAVAKAIRSRQMKFIAFSCHDDVIPWLNPDWIYELPESKFTREPRSGRFSWRCLRRCPLALTIRRVRSSAWELFRDYHYLSGAIHPGSHCFVGCFDEKPVAFTAALSFPHLKRPGWREHRTVCLPDYQGLGIGQALSEFVAGMFHATGRPYRSVTSHPAMIGKRTRSPNWKLTRKPGHCNASRGRPIQRHADRRITASFEYVGPARPVEANLFGIRQAQPSMTTQFAPRSA